MDKQTSPSNIGGYTLAKPIAGVKSDGNIQYTDYVRVYGTKTDSINVGGIFLGQHNDTDGNTPGVLSVYGNSGDGFTALRGSEVASGFNNVYLPEKAGTLALTDDIPTKVSELTNDSNFTSNAGTITGIKMNGSSKGTSGVVDLGTVITSHQDISGKMDKSGGTFTGSISFNSNSLDKFDDKPQYLVGIEPFADGGTLKYKKVSDIFTSESAASGGTTTSLVTTGEKYTWNNKASTSVATTSANGLMSSTDKTKLNGIDTGAQTNKIETIKVNGVALSISNKAVDVTVPTYEDKTAESEGTATSLVTTGEKYTWNNKADKAVEKDAIGSIGSARPIANINSAGEISYSKRVRTYGGLNGEQKYGVLIIGENGTDNSTYGALSICDRAGNFVVIKTSDVLPNN